MFDTSALRDRLYDPRVRGIGVDDDRLLEIHATILREKPLLRSAFAAFYRDMGRICDTFFLTDGLEIELGSGAGFLKELRPAVITTDVRQAATIDRRIDALNIDLPQASVRCIYAINVFHHLPDPDRFFSELIRVLKPRGGCVLVEPHIGPASAALHKRLHTDERFDPAAQSWINTDIAGPLSGANQALAYIVFDRDLEIFRARYGDQLEIAQRSYATNALRYLLSGGLNFRQLAPSFSIPVLQAAERLGRCLAKYWSLHQIIVLQRRP